MTLKCRKLVGCGLTLYFLNSSGVINLFPLCAEATAHSLIKIDEPHITNVSPPCLRQKEAEGHRALKISLT